MDIRSKIAKSVTRPSPKTKKSLLPVSVTEATWYALWPERLNGCVLLRMDLLYETHVYFRGQIDKLRAHKPYYLSLMRGDVEGSF